MKKICMEAPLIALLSARCFALLNMTLLLSVLTATAQTWGIGTGNWLSPTNKNVGCQMSAQFGDGVGNDTIFISVDFYSNECSNYLTTVGTGTLVYDTFRLAANTVDAGFSIYYLNEDTLYSFQTGRTGSAGVWQIGGRYKYQYGVWDSATGGAGFPYTELSVFDTLTNSDRFRLRIDTSYGITASAYHDSILWQIDMDDNLYLGVDSALRVDNTGAISIVNNITPSTDRMVIIHPNGLLDTAVISTGSGFTIDASENMFAGTDAGAALTNTAAQNLLIGILAGSQIDSGEVNTCIGYASGINLTTSGYNTFIGHLSGSNATGTHNTCIGSGADIQSGFNYSVSIGFEATATASNQLVVGGITNKILQWLPGTNNETDLGAASVRFDSVFVRSPVFTTASPASGAACTEGSITWDASYIYVCTASGAWKRAALTGGY